MSFKSNFPDILFSILLILNRNSFARLRPFYNAVMIVMYLRSKIAFIYSFEQKITSSMLSMYSFILCCSFSAKNNSKFSIFSPFKTLFSSSPFFLFFFCIKLIYIYNCSSLSFSFFCLAKRISCSFIKCWKYCSSLSNVDISCTPEKAYPNLLLVISKSFTLFRLLQGVWLLFLPLNWSSRLGSNPSILMFGRLEFYEFSLCIEKSKQKLLFVEYNLFNLEENFLKSMLNQQSVVKRSFIRSFAKQIRPFLSLWATFQFLVVISLLWTVDCPFLAVLKVSI